MDAALIVPEAELLPLPAPAGLLHFLLLLTFFLMSPVYNRIHEEALQPYLAEEISQEEALPFGLLPTTDILKVTSVNGRTKKIRMVDRTGRNCYC